MAGQQLSDSLQRRPVDSATDDLIHTYVGLPQIFRYMEETVDTLPKRLTKQTIDISVRTKLTAKAYQRLPLSSSC